MSYESLEIGGVSNKIWKEIKENKMIEIIYGHKIINGTLYRKVVAIGHGLPHNGQLDFLSYTIEKSSTETGKTTHATMKWGIGWWRVKAWRMRRFISNLYK